MFIREIIKKAKIHWLGLLLAFIVGLLAVWPTLYSINKVGRENFKGIYPMFSNDEVHYLSQIKEVLDGHPELGNTFIAEHKDRPAARPAFAARILAGVSGIFNISVPKLGAINDFFLPAAGFVLLYFLFFRVTKNKRISVFFPVFYFIIFLREFGRPINPQFSFIFFILGLLALTAIIENLEIKKKFIFYNILLGVVLGLLIRLYPYYWTSIFVLYAVYFFLLIIKEKRFFYYLSGWVVFALVALFTSLTYFININKAALNPFFPEVSARLGMVSTHWPGCFINVSLLVVSLLAVYLIKDKIRDYRRLFLAYSLPLSGIIVNWQNIITGKYLQFSSHYYLVTILFVLLALAIITEPAIKSYKESKSKIVLLFFFLVLSFLFYRHSHDALASIYVSEEKIEKTAGDQELSSVASWINANTLPDSSFLTFGEDYGWLIPIYTRGNLFTNAYASYYLTSDEELEDRWVIKNIFNKNFNAEYIFKGYRGFLGNKFLDEYQNKEVRRKIKEFFTRKKYEENVLLPSEYIAKVLNKYDNYKNLDLGELFSLYSIDYILLDKNSVDKEIIEKFDTEERFKLLEEIGGSKIYKFIKY
ncbi:MAG: hypothetical protein PHR36_00435 [Patescibacteria group bacterium]|nr:hypothetical protein [Patescibacteria group bacterium]